MRAFTKFGKRGFTLVELMIVVAIIGVLAALAIYGVRRYLATAKTSEAKNTIGAIARGAAAAYERETTVSEIVAEGSTATAANHALCGNAASVPSTGVTGVKGVKYQPDSTPGKDFEAGDTQNGWKCLKFSINSPIYYAYSYFGDGTSPVSTGGGWTGTLTAPAFEAGAEGDLDGDTIPSYFARTGQVNATTGTIRLATQVFIANEFE